MECIVDVVTDFDVVALGPHLVDGASFVGACIGHRIGDRIIAFAGEAGIAVVRVEDTGRFGL